MVIAGVDENVFLHQKTYCFVSLCEFQSGWLTPFADIKQKNIFFRMLPTHLYMRQVRKHIQYPYIQ